MREQDAARPEPDEDEERRDLAQTIGAKEAGKLRARRAQGDSVIAGLGLFGIVGWSVALPTVIGVAVGLWIDATFPSRFSWTLMLLLLGVGLGCLNAWYWVTRERDLIREGEEERRG